MSFKKKARKSEVDRFREKIENTPNVSGMETEGNLDEDIKRMWEHYCRARNDFSDEKCVIDKFFLSYVTTMCKHALEEMNRPYEFKSVLYSIFTCTAAQIRYVSDDDKFDEDGNFKGPENIGGYA
jgi:hypothetical protein